MTNFEKIIGCKTPEELAKCLRHDMKLATCYKCMAVDYCAICVDCIEAITRYLNEGFNSK